MSIFTTLFKRNKKEEKSDDYQFYLNRPYANPDVADDVVSNLYQFLDFILSYVKPNGDVDLYPSYVYTHHLIQSLKEVNHPILNRVLNRSVHWFMRKEVADRDVSFTTFRILSLFDLKHSAIQKYLIDSLPKILKDHVNSRQEIHLQAFDGYLNSPMKQEEDSAITGAYLLLKYHENLLIKDDYFDDEGNSRLLKLVENSLKWASERIWERQVHRSYLYNISSFLYTCVLFRQITGKHEMDNDINKSIIELNFYQKKNIGLWENDIFQSAFIFNNIVSIRRILGNDSRLETIFTSFHDNFLANYQYQDMIGKMVSYSNFLLMSTLLQGFCKILNNDDVNDIVFKLKEKKFKI